MTTLFAVTSTYADGTEYESPLARLGGDPLDLLELHAHSAMRRWKAGSIACFSTDEVGDLVQEVRRFAPVPGESS